MARANEKSGAPCGEPLSILAGVDLNNKGRRTPDCLYFRKPRRSIRAR
jgi:hypothetical protein